MRCCFKILFSHLLLCKLLHKILNPPSLNKIYNIRCLKEMKIALVVIEGR